MSTREEIARKDRRTAKVLSGIVFGIILLLCFFLTAFTITDPPPGERYVAVGMADFGDVVTAGGDDESEIPSEEVQEVVDREVSQPTPTESTPQEVTTQESSDVSVPTSPSPQPDPTPDPEPDPQPSDALSQALQQIGQSGVGGSQGDTEGTGNQGDKDGQIDGMGVVQGDGGDNFSLSGRSQLAKPRIEEAFAEEGVVVVDIWVNRNGDVVRAVANPRDPRTNTPSSSLHRLAEKAARTARFNTNLEAAVEQRGTITIRFILK